MPGEPSYNSWGSAGGLPPLGSLTLNYSVTIPNSNNFPDESDSGTARTGNQVGARSAATQYRALYSDVYTPEQFDDAPYVPPRSAYRSHDPSAVHGHTRTHGIPSYPSPAESVDSGSSSSDQGHHDLASYPSHYPQQHSHYPAYLGAHRLGLEHVHAQYAVQPSAGATDVNYQLPLQAAYHSGNILAPELYHDQTNQELGVLHQSQSSPSSLPGSQGSLQTFQVNSPADERSSHLLFEDAGPYLRETLRIPSYQDVNLWALPDPPEGEKPNQPYPILIKLAIYGSPNKQLTLQEIYNALEDRFEWFRVRKHEKAWKNSIRHNLSLNKVFKHVPRAITEPGKGSYWQLDCSSGEGYKRARKRRSKSARAASVQDDDDNFSEGDVEGLSASQSHVASPAASDDSHIDPELRPGSHVVGERRTRSVSRRAGATSPYPVTGSSQQSPRYQSQLLPHDSAPRFGQPSFGQAQFGRPGLGQPQPRGPVTSVSSPSVFMSVSPTTFGSVTSSRPGDGFVAQDRNASTIQHAPKPTTVIQNQGGLPSARRVQSYPEAQPYSSQESASSQRSSSGYYFDPKGKSRMM